VWNYHFEFPCFVKKTNVDVFGAKSKEIAHTKPALSAKDQNIF
jgi:hypothetical protein